LGLTPHQSSQQKQICNSNKKITPKQSKAQTVLKKYFSLK
jgi:hypothetical protein